jgi:hypothetical protein
MLFSFKNSVYLLFFCSCFIACNDAKVRFSPEEQEHIDTTFFNKKKILATQMDSFCTKSMNNMIDHAKDSIMTRRMNDIERLQKIDTLK